MTLKSIRQRWYASIIILGSGFLLYRTVTMMAQGYLTIFVWWVAALLVLEFFIDAACLPALLTGGRPMIEGNHEFPCDSLQL